MGANLVNVILGMKVRQARLEAGLTLTAFAAQCGLAPSYVTDIEKGRKHPRGDKIMRMAEVLGRNYDELVSIKLDPSLSYLESTLSSSILQRFPFDEFGLEAGDLVNLLTRQPEKASALLHAMLELIRQYDLREEDFLRAALRSYQEMHENYFPDLEQAVEAFREEHRRDLPKQEAPGVDALTSVLRKSYGYTVDDTVIVPDHPLATYRTVFLDGANPRLYLNSRLLPRQARFLLAREIGYRYLGLQERSQTSTPDQIDSLQQIVNDFRAAYFGGALLMPQKSMLKDIGAFFERTQWDARPLVDVLHRYDITPEMFLYRFSELVPQFFGVRLHFLRFHHAGDTFRLVKHLNMNQVAVPSIGWDEHNCRRWLSIGLLRRAGAASTEGLLEEPLIGAQVSEFLETGDRFFSFGFARPLALAPGVNSSSVVGFRVDDAVRKAIGFVEDTRLAREVVNATCERCPLSAEACAVRAAPPRLILAEEKRRARRESLERLKG